MIIIIEGPDGAGKTTLANKLQKQTGYMLLHRSQPKSEEEKAKMMAEYMDVLKSGKNCIMDRCWYSEMVYGPVMRDAAVISYPQMYALERQLARAGGLVIHCTGSLQTLWKRCLTRGEDYIVDKDTFTKIYNGYDELMNGVPHTVPVVTYEYKDL